jgi:anhydro-N-acetylmuramic acid kinase
MTSRYLIGLASGSGGDGVDAVLLQVEGTGLNLRARPIHVLHRPHPRELRELMARVGTEVRQMSLLHRLLGETFAAAARQVADEARFALTQVSCIGCSGHVVGHEPEGRFPSVLELGMPAVVAERTGVTVVSDLRPRDLAAGGQGGPLEPLAERLLFLHAHEHRVRLHLGGLATLVYLPAGARPGDVLGVEAGPCGLFLDGLVRQLSGGREAFDAGGKQAVQGRCMEPLLERWLDHPCLQRPLPRSLPRQAFGEEFVTQTVRMARQKQWNLHDLLCTATHFVARAIALTLRRLLPPGQRLDRVLLSGGGIRNGLLWHLLEQQLAGIPLERTDAHGVPADGLRALTTGVLAALTLDGVPANLPQATGAAGARLLGSITPGSPANWARCVNWMMAQNGTESVRH